MNDNKLTGWLRTVVPGLWSAGIAWLVARGVPDSVTAILGGFGEQLIVPVVLGLVYAGLRWVEQRIPTWLATLLLGSAKTPIYAPQGPDGVHVITSKE